MRDKERIEYQIYTLGKELRELMHKLDNIADGLIDAVSPIRGNRLDGAGDKVEQFGREYHTNLRKAQAVRAQILKLDPDWVM